MKTPQKNIYIDIDGVILTKGGIPALHLDQFLKHVLKNHSIFWLTPRCRGDSKYTVKYLSQFLLPDTVILTEKIKPTNFQVDKTEAIDFNRGFLWLDDDLFVSEKNTLKERGKFDSWIEVDLIKNPDQLLDLTRSKFF